MRSVRRPTIALLAMLALSACSNCSEDAIPGAESAQPEPPVVSVAPLTCGPLAALAGTKQSATSIWVNGEEIVPYDESTTFSASVRLDEGVQALDVSAKGASGVESKKVTISTTVDLLPPSPPTVEPVPSPVPTTSYVLAGSKPAGTALLVNGIERVPHGDETTWSFTAELQFGSNAFMIRTDDGCYESDAIVVNVLHDPTGIEITLDPVESPTCLSSQRLTGTRGAGVDVYVNEALVLEADTSSGAWSHVYELRPGSNPLRIVGRKSGRSSAPREALIEYDDDRPDPPTLDPIAPYTSSASVVLTGTKPPDTALLLDGMEAEPLGPGVSYVLRVDLGLGLNSFQIDTQDRCGRSSGSPQIASITRDDVAPIVVVVTPSEGAIIDGVVAIEGRVFDEAIASVSVTVDDAALPVVLGAITTGTTAFSASWDTSTASDGAHRIRVIALDRAGTPSQSVDRMVTVTNAVLLISEESGVGDPSEADSSQPAIAVLANGDVAIAWHDNYDVLGGGNDDDILLRVLSAGDVAGPIALISDHARDGTSQNVQIAAGFAGEAHIVWNDDGDIDGDGVGEADILYRRLEGAGALGPPVVVSIGLTDGVSRFPHAAVDLGGAVHVVWQDDGDLDGDGSPDLDIYYASGGAGGFSAPVLLSDDANDGASARPQIAITPDGRIHVAWQDDGIDGDGAIDVYYRSRTALGAWSAPVLVSEEPGYLLARLPAIAADPADPSGIVYVTYDATGDVAGSGPDGDVFLRFVANDLVGPLTLVSDHASDGTSAEASVTVDAAGSVHVVFWDTGNIGGSGGDADIYSRTFNGALQPLAPVSDLEMDSFNRELSVGPAIAASASRLYIVWQDRSPYDGDAIADSDVVLWRRSL